MHDAVSKRGSSYTAEFEWLLQHLDFDLMEFEELDKELRIQRTVDGVPTEFSLVFPAKVGHCHYHVWWSEGE